MAKPTLRDVAERAGVSSATASKALNGRADIAEQTRTRVARAATELDYLPKSRTVPQDRPLVSLITDSIDAYYSCEVLRGMVEEGARRGIDVVARIESRASGPRLSTREWERTFLRSGVTGIVLLVYHVDSPVFEVAERRRAPVVAIDPYTGSLGASTTISSTNWEGSKAATEHLLQLGHRRIAVITGTSDFIPGNERLHGYRAAMLDAGLAVEDALIFEGNYTFGSGFDAAERMLELSDPPTAVFALSDRMALGAVRAFQSHGIRVPEDVSVVGFDNSPGTDLSTPGLTTVGQPLAAMGRLAVKSIEELSTVPAAGPQRMQLATHLIVRASTAPPRRSPALVG
ncbi:MAG TPA: LacI family DNA-binding transcriptional regulator [Cellulomonas sp.]